MNRPCLTCGEPTDSTRCPDCRPPVRRLSATERGYDRRWRVLSERARRLQPFCLHCGTADDLQTDHTPDAWKRHEDGKPIRLQDVRVLCGPCNRAAGRARGVAPSDRDGDSRGRPESGYTPPGGMR